MNRYKKEIIIVCLLLLAATVIIYVIDLDLILQRMFYDQEKGWYLANETPWQQIRDYSSLPALLLAVGSLLGIILGYNFQRYAPYRRVFIYFVVLMVAGPGLIVNVILKDNFGRPRPRNIIEFSGKYEHEKPLVYDASSPGKSFPCGHASMGFYFLGVYILYRRRRQFLANLGLVTGIFWGGLIGITRMLQGGHFFSDVIYSAGLIYLTALILYHSLKFSPDLKIKTREISTSKKRILTAALSILIILLILGVLLATPRNKSHTVKFERSAIEQAKLIKVDLHLLEADFQILQADSLYLRWQFEGFGFPKSNIRHTLQTSWQDSIYVINLEQYIRGHFTELQQSVRLYLPESTAIEITGTNGDKEIDY